MKQISSQHVDLGITPKTSCFIIIQITFPLAKLWWRRGLSKENEEWGSESDLWGDGAGWGGREPPVRDRMNVCTGWYQRWLNMKGRKNCTTKWFLLVLWRTVNLWWFLIKTNIYLEWGKRSLMTNVKGLTIITNITITRKVTWSFFYHWLDTTPSFATFFPMSSLFLTKVLQKLTKMAWK